MNADLVLSLDAGHCRQARALLRWTQAELAAAACVAENTVGHFEREWQAPETRTKFAIFAAMEGGGVEFRRENHGRIAVYRADKNALSAL